MSVPDAFVEKSNFPVRHGKTFIKLNKDNESECMLYHHFDPDKDVGEIKTPEKSVLYQQLYSIRTERGILTTLIELNGYYDVYINTTFNSSNDISFLRTFTDKDKACKFYLTIVNQIYEKGLKGIPKDMPK